jgi:hypothetical protein
MNRNRNLNIDFLLSGSDRTVGTGVVRLRVARVTGTCGSEMIYNVEKETKEKVPYPHRQLAPTCTFLVLVAARVLGSVLAGRVLGSILASQVFGAAGGFSS